MMHNDICGFNNSVFPARLTIAHSGRGFSFFCLFFIASKVKGVLLSTVSKENCPVEKAVSGNDVMYLVSLPYDPSLKD
jgi:hypothetical protein